MTEGNTILKSRKKSRINIYSIEDLKKALKIEGYRIYDLSKDNFKEKITSHLNIDDRLVEELYKLIVKDEINFKVDNISGLIDYIEKIIFFEELHNKLCEKIKGVEHIHIHRIEYERVSAPKEDVSHIVRIIEEIKEEISESITEEEYLYIESLEKEIDKEYLYTKDIELLKRMLVNSSTDLKEEYNKETMIKRVSIKLSEKIESNYIKPLKGSVEYYQHISSNIPRLKRLIKNIHKYIEKHEAYENEFNINQSSALQDSINLAVATYNDNEFRAISGSNDVLDYCTVVPMDKSAFISRKVNKLGELGVGYNRVNDSEKKILEEINKQIESGKLKDEGNLILYSKFEPCPSCYYVISQFMKKYPKIKIHVKYKEKYIRIID